MTKEECEKKILECRAQAVTIDDSINWIAERAYYNLGEYEKLEGCETLACEKQKLEFLIQANKYIHKLENENKMLDKYGDNLKKVIHLCPPCSSGEVNF